MRADEGIHPADGVDEGKLCLALFDDALDARDEGLLHIEHTVEGGYEVISLDVFLAFQDGVEDAFLLQDADAEVVEVDADRGDAFFLQALLQTTDFWCYLGLQFFGKRLDIEGKFATEVGAKLWVDELAIYALKEGVEVLGC